MHNCTSLKLRSLDDQCPRAGLALRDTDGNVPTTSRCVHMCGQQRTSSTTMSYIASSRVLVALVTLLSCVDERGVQAVADAKPNILVMLADDLGEALIPLHTCMHACALCICTHMLADSFCAHVFANRFVRWSCIIAHMSISKSNRFHTHTHTHTHTHILIVPAHIVHTCTHVRAQDTETLVATDGATSRPRISTVWRVMASSLNSGSRQLQSAHQGMLEERCLCVCVCMCARCVQGR